METERDRTLLAHVEELVAEEHELWNRGARDERGQQRLQDLKVELDRCWDLLRQRRALADAGRNPDEAKVRPASVVESYEG
jgi:hypothetical protein